MNLCKLSIYDEITLNQNFDDVDVIISQAKKHGKDFEEFTPRKAYPKLKKPHIQVNASFDELKKGIYNNLMCVMRVAPTTDIDCLWKLINGLNDDEEGRIKLELLVHLSKQRIPAKEESKFLIGQCLELIGMRNIQHVQNLTPFLKILHNDSVKKNLCKIVNCPSNVYDYVLNNLTIHLYQNENSNIYGFCTSSGICMNVGKIQNRLSYHLDNDIVVTAYDVFLKILTVHEFCNCLSRNFENDFNFMPTKQGRGTMAEISVFGEEINFFGAVDLEALGKSWFDSFEEAVENDIIIPKYPITVCHRFIQRSSYFAVKGIRQFIWK
jgi:hypothetical protein